MGTKTYLTTNVYDAAITRLELIFDQFERVCVSFSGGKDSTALVHLAAQVARERGRTIDVLFVDWEAQYQATIDHVTHVVIDNPTINPIWICLPLATPNESSFHDPMWVAWHRDAEDRWVRKLPAHAGVISDYDTLSFYEYGMTFEAFIPAFNAWYTEQYKSSAFLVGIRSDESLNRFRAIKRTQGRKRYKDIAWSTKVADTGYNFYPIYDWHVEDVWGYIGKYNIPYNHIYDKMYLAGLSLHQMRICEPFSLEARKYLNLYQQLEPEVWEKLVYRVGGANFGAQYGQSHLFAYLVKEKPDALTWKEYSLFLLETMPAPLRDHYQQKIDVFIGWFR